MFAQIQIENNKNNKTLKKYAIKKNQKFKKKNKNKKSN